MRTEERKETRMKAINSIYAELRLKFAGKPDSVKVDWLVRQLAQCMVELDRQADEPRGAHV